MKKEKLKGIFIGFIIGTLLMGTSAACFAAVKTEWLEAYFQNIKIYVDRQAVTPKDANGNVVEPFIVNGTTYLPVRAVAGALGKEVSWDNASKAVYIGVQPGMTAEKTLKPAVEYLGYSIMDIKKELGTNYEYSEQNNIKHYVYDAFEIAFSSESGDKVDYVSVGGNNKVIGNAAVGMNFDQLSQYLPLYNDFEEYTDDGSDLIGLYKGYTIYIHWPYVDGTEEMYGYPLADQSKPCDYILVGFDVIS